MTKEELKRLVDKIQCLAEEVSRPQPPQFSNTIRDIALAAIHGCLDKLQSEFNRYIDVLEPLVNLPVDYTRYQEDVYRALDRQYFFGRWTTRDFIRRACDLLDTKKNPPEGPCPRCHMFHTRPTCYTPRFRPVCYIRYCPHCGKEVG